MATKKQVLALAETLGATITDSGTCLELEAPAGFTVAPEQHAYTYDVLDGRAGVWDAIHDDLKVGFEPCTTPNCDWCE
jgi:hypothetical protein